MLPRLLGPILGLTALLFVGCAHGSVALTPSVESRDAITSASRVFVMQASAGARQVTQGGRTFETTALVPPALSEQITNRIIEIVIERDRRAEVVETPILGRAVSLALAKGATHLVVSEVAVWREAATQTTTEPDRIEIRLQFLRLEPRTVVTTVVFKNRGGMVAIRDKPVTRLLDDSFRRAVQRLIDGR
jgi:hypothetical protein